MKKFFKVFYSQIFNAFFPILIVAILLKLPGEEYTAAIFLLINFANVYLLFSDYSSNITFIRNAVQEGGITEKEVAPAIINDINNYLGLKAILLFFGFFIWLVLCFTTPLLRAHVASNIMAYTFIVGYNLNFYWIYMSSNKELFFILSNFFSRLFLILLLLLFIWYKLNFFYLMPIAGVGSIIITTGFFLHFARIHNIPIIVSKRKLSDAIIVIKQDWPLVANTFLLMNPTIFLSLFIGFVKNSTYVIIYGLAEKIFFAIRALLSVFVNSLYPVLCSPNSLSRKKVNLIYLMFYGFIVVGCSMLYFISPTIVSYFELSPSQNTVFNNCLFYFILTLLAISLNVPFFISLLVDKVINSKKAFGFLSIATTAVGLIFLFNTIFNNGIISVVQSLFLAESMIALTFIILYLVRKNDQSNQVAKL